MKSLTYTSILLLFAFASYSQEIRSFQKDGLYGFSENGTTTIAPEYNYAFDFKEGLALVKKGSSWGFINEKNTVVIPFSYDRCSEFSNGFAIVMKQGKSGVLDTKGTFVVPVECSHVVVLKDGYCIGQKNGKYALFKAGDRLTEFEYDEISMRRSSYFTVKRNKLYGAIDSLGMQLIEPKLATRPYYYSHRELEGVGYFIGQLKEGGANSYLSKSGEVLLNGDEYKLRRIHYPSIFAATKDGMTKVVDVYSGSVLLPPSDVVPMEQTWRPCDGYGYSSTQLLFFEKKDASILMVSVNQPSNTAEIKAFPTVFEEFILVQKENGLSDIYSHDVELIASNVHAIIDDMGTFNAEVRICSIADRNLMLWKDGSVGHWNQDSQSIEFVTSQKIGPNLLFDFPNRSFTEGATMNFIYSDTSNFIFEIVSGNTKTVYLFKDYSNLWEMDTFNAGDKITCKKLQYEEFEEDGEQIKELYNVVLKINGKKENYGW